MKKNHIIGVVVALVVVGGAAFYAGTSYAKSGTPTRGQFNASFTTGAGGPAGFAGRTGMMGGARGSGGFTAGKIISNSNGSISIEQQNGSSTEIVLVSPSTQVLKQVSGTASDLTAGTEVVVTGTTNSDGSLTASSIQIRPAGAAGMTMQGARVQ